MFGVDDLFFLIAGGAYATKKCFDQIGENGRNIAIKNAINKYVEEHTDSELEEKLKNDIENPAKYNEIYERIEAYKQNDGKYYLIFKDDWEWNSVGKLRLPVRDKHGSLYGRTKKESSILYENRYAILYMLMLTYDKMTKPVAEWAAIQKYQEGRPINY